jgi:hypothetical protein
MLLARREELLLDFGRPVFEYNLCNNNLNVNGYLFSLNGNRVLRTTALCPTEIRTLGPVCVCVCICVDDPHPALGEESLDIRNVKTSEVFWEGIPFN